MKTEAKTEAKARGQYRGLIAYGPRTPFRLVVGPVEPQFDSETGKWDEGGYSVRATSRGHSQNIWRARDLAGEGLIPSKAKAA